MGSGPYELQPPSWRRPSCSPLCRPDEHTLRCDRADYTSPDESAGPVHLIACARELFALWRAERRRRPAS